MKFVVVDLNAWDDVVEHVWGFATREDAEAFCEANWGHGYSIHEIAEPPAPVA